MVLTVFTLILLPFLAIVYNERVAIQQEKKALNFLDIAITSWIYESGTLETELVDLNTTYRISLIEEDSQQLKACIAWRGANDRQYEVCERGKR